MKEYRIVCTLKTVYPDGSEFIREHTPLLTSTANDGTYRTKADAMKALSDVVRHMRKFDAETQKRLANGERDARGFWHSDIRIQSRTVSEWKD